MKATVAMLTSFGLRVHSSTARTHTVRHFIFTVLLSWIQKILNLLGTDTESEIACSDNYRAG